MKSTTVEEGFSQTVQESIRQPHDYRNRLFSPRGAPRQVKTIRCQRETDRVQGILGRVPESHPGERDGLEELWFSTF